MAKNDKVASQISAKDKKTSLGESLIMLQQKEQEALMFLKNMQENIKVIIDTAVNLNCTYVIIVYDTISCRNLKIIYYTFVTLFTLILKMTFVLKMQKSKSITSILNGIVIYIYNLASSHTFI